VLAVSQPAGLLLILVFIPVFGADPISADKLAIAFLAGAASLGGLWAFYAAMAMGTVSVVAPIASLGVVVPVAVGLAQGESPATVQLIGLVAATAGVVILSYEESPEHAGVARRSIILAILAGLGFGIFFTALDAASPDRPGWAILAVRLGGVATVGAALLVSRPNMQGIGTAAPVLVVIGAFDVLANALFAVASTKGILPVVAVGGSMYPAFTIALAHGVLGERLASIQWSGVALALLGVALIAAGT
jgi:drug/metabolite transporter (DMT)-like permease